MINPTFLDNTEPDCTNCQTAKLVGNVTECLEKRSCDQQVSFGHTYICLGRSMPISVVHNSLAEKLKNSSSP